MQYDNYLNNEINTNSEGTNWRDIPKIRVVVRKRPPNKKEIQKNDIDIIEARGAQTVVVKELKNKVDLTKYIEEHHFAFDMAYDEFATNEMIYLETVRPMVEAAFNKSKITCFAYGQTGSGKTYTMMGFNNSKGTTIPGLYLLCAYDIFSYLEEEQYNHLSIGMSFYEIYCGKLYDLLNERNPLIIREDGNKNICIVGLQEKPVDNLKSLMNTIEFGLKARTVGVTGANMDSSRSHAILQICLKDSNGNTHGKISFIDLAGSERAVDTIDTNKQTKIDGAEINKSLLALKECIRALDQEKKHTPFRGSKLTLVLRDSFMGNCKTLMIANISPSLSCSEHTLNTLRYADRVKELRKEKAEREAQNQNGEKDPSEILAHLMMMPREHSKTVKYNVDTKKLKEVEKEQNKNLASKKSGVMHINQLYQPQKSSNVQNARANSNSNSNTNNAHNSHNPQNAYNAHSAYPQQSNNASHARLPRLSSSQDPKKQNNPTNSFDINTYTSKYKLSAIKSDEDFQQLSNEHEKMINSILQEEEDFIIQHKAHIDEMVDSIKQEMNIINEVDRPGSDIETYTATLDKLLLDKVEKINAVRKRLYKFRVMLKDEEVLASKFSNSNYGYEYDVNKDKNFDDVYGNEDYEDDYYNYNDGGKN